MKLRLITPSLNQARYIERCVRSVMSQERDRIELDYLVLDAESTDGSKKILERLHAEFPQMRLVVGPDEGQADALARGFADCGTDVDILGWLNADDVLLPGCLAQIAAAFADSSVGIAYGKAWFIDEDDLIIGAYPVSPFDRSYLRTFCFLSQPSTFFRRSAYEHVGGIDPALHYCMDYGLWIRLANAGAGFRFLPRYLSATRLHGATKTARGALAFADEVVATLERECGSAPLPWHVYRRYRERAIQRPESSGALHFAAALTETAYRSGEWWSLFAWSARVLWNHAQAKVAWVCRSPKRLAAPPGPPSTELRPLE